MFLEWKRYMTMPMTTELKEGKAVIEIEKLKCFHIRDAPRSIRA